MSNYNDCFECLLKNSEEKGYLTFNDIMNTTDAFSLSLVETDKICEAIQLRGVIVYEDEPENNADSLEDHSRTDYDLIYDEIIDLSEELKELVEQIRGIPAPQNKEVSLLTAQNANNSLYARERLILLHLRIVLKIALSMTKQYDLEITDAVSSGVVGLITAIDKYDPNGFSNFQSYASLWIQQLIQRDCAPKWMIYYFPHHIKEKVLLVWNKVKSNYSWVNDKSLYVDEMLEAVNNLSKTYDISDEEISKIIMFINSQINGAIYLDEVFNINDEPLIEMVSSQNVVYADEIAEERILNEVVRNIILNSLNPRERSVIQHRFGIDTSEKTLEETGQIFGVSRERIRQIEAKALRKLRHPSRSKLYKSFWEQI